MIKHAETFFTIRVQLSVTGKRRFCKMTARYVGLKQKCGFLSFLDINSSHFPGVYIDKTAPNQFWVLICVNLCEISKWGTMFNQAFLLTISQA